MRIELNLRLKSWRLFPLHFCISNSRPVIVIFLSLLRCRFAMILLCSSSLGTIRDLPVYGQDVVGLPETAASTDLISEISRKDVATTSPAQATPSSDDQIEAKISAAALAGHNAWMLTSCALVLFMTAPGLAMFYGGLVRKKNVLSVMMQCVFLMGMMTIALAILGYSLA